MPAAQNEDNAMANKFQQAHLDESFWVGNQDPRHEWELRQRKHFAQHILKNALEILSGSLREGIRYEATAIIRLQASHIDTLP